MNYDFDREIRRIGTSCSKWDSKESYRTGEVLPMWVADMDFAVAEPILKRVRQRAEHPIMGYVYQNPDFAAVTAGWMERRHGWHVSADWVTFSPGVVPAISAAVQALTEPGDSVMIQSPVYYPFRDTICACKRTVVDNPLKCVNGRYEMDFEDMEQKIKSCSVKLFIFCNPHNPVGRVYTREELEAMGEICARHGVRIFSDEIHSDLILNGHRHVPLASLSTQLSGITMTGVAPSKSFNLAGLQTAAVISENREMRAAFERIIKMNGIQFPNVFGLESYLAAYTDGEEYLEQLVGYLEENLRYCRMFFETHLWPLRLTDLEGTYLLWIDCRKLEMNAEQLDDFMLNKAHLALDSGYWFGEMGKGFMRMNIACRQDTLKKALDQLYAALRES